MIRYQNRPPSNPRAKPAAKAKKTKKGGDPKAEQRPLVSSGFVIPGVVHEALDYSYGYPQSKIKRYARANAKKATTAERALRNILNGLNGGVLKGRFVEQHVISGKWIVDFFFPEVRLAIEVDGSYHNSISQRHKDKLKEADCVRFDITLIRIRNYEVHDDREVLVEKLRNGWRQAKNRENRIIGKTVPLIQA